MSKYNKNRFLRPLNNMVLLIPYKQKNIGGIELTTNSTDTQLHTTGVISAMGNKVDDTFLKEGKVVRINSRQGVFMEWEGDRCILIHEGDILCIDEGLRVYNSKDGGMEMEVIPEDEEGEL